MGLLLPYAGRYTFVGLSIKPANLKDLPLLGEIRRNAIMAQPETFWTFEEKCKAADAWETMDVQNNFELYKLFLNENDSAFIGWKQNYLGYLFILPEAQGKGIGDKLLKLAEAEISKEHNYIWLYAHPYSERFYQKHGYVKQRETENPFGTTLLHKFQKNF